MGINYYIAHLKCNHCGAISPKDSSTEISNKLEFEPGIWEVEVGTTIDADLEEVQAEYVEIHLPQSAQIKCVELWICPHCRQQNFVEITFLEQAERLLVQHMQSIMLTPSYLDQIHYVTYWINEWAGRFGHPKLFSGLKPPLIAIEKLKQVLKDYYSTHSLHIPMTKYFSTTGEILNTTLNQIVSIFEQDDIDWNLRYKNAATLFFKLNEQIDGIVYTHKTQGNTNDYFVKANLFYTKANQALEIIQHLGNTFEKYGLVYNFEIYAQNSENEQEYEIKHPLWGKEVTNTLTLYTYIQSTFPPEWLSHMYNDFEGADHPEAGVDIRHPDNAEEYLTVLILLERIGVGVLKKAEEDIVIDFAPFDYTFEQSQLAQAQQFLQHFRDTGNIRFPIK